MIEFDTSETFVGVNFLFPEVKTSSPIVNSSAYLNRKSSC